MITDELVYQQKIQKEKQEKTKLIEEKLLLQEEIEEIKFVNAKILEKIKEDYEDQLACAKKEQATEIADVKAAYQRKAENMIRKIIAQYTEKSAQLIAQHQTLEKQLEKQYEKELSVMAQKKLTAETNMKHMHHELLECKRIISELRKKQTNYTVVL
ncbi:MAG: hypothetical protein ACHQAX_08240 [Gammaproteobacteria bacterium]